MNKCYVLTKNINLMVAKKVDDCKDLDETDFQVIGVIYLNDIEFKWIEENVINFLNSQLFLQTHFKVE